MLDHALAGHNGTIGVPVMGGIEIYGKWETGKSTLAMYLIGRVKPDGIVVLCDLEGGARQDYTIKCLEQAGFDGTVIYVEHEDKDGEMRTHESMMQETADYLFDENVGGFILDSAAATRPVMEMKGDMGASYMGRRAQALAQFSRRWGPIINYMKAGQLAIIVNHMLQDFDGFGKYSPGGDSPKFWINARLWIHRKETFDEGDFIAEVVVEKLRFGGKSKFRKADIVILQGVGVSPELSNLWALKKLKGARSQKGTGMIQYLDGAEWVNVARRKTLFDQTRAGDVAWYVPIGEKLEANDGVVGERNS